MVYVNIAPSPCLHHLSRRGTKQWPLQGISGEMSEVEAEQNEKEETRKQIGKCISYHHIRISLPF